jgi:pimeloyl-ACP methyl ester carboxylesterase
MIAGRPQRGFFAVDPACINPSSPHSCLNTSPFFTMTGAYVLTGVDASPIKQWPAPGQLVSVGEHRLHLHCKGQGGPTLVLEAGMAGWSQDWAFVHDGLAQVGQVCSYDRAGYGWSDAAATPRNGMDAVDDLRRALDAAGIPSLYLLAGHSFGGLLAAMFARAYPKEIAGLALIDAVGRDYEAQFPPERYRKFRSSLGRTLMLADMFSPLGIPRLIHLPASLIAERLPAGERATAIAMSYSRRHYRALRLEDAGFDDVLKQALRLGPLPAVPTLVLSSEQMRDFPPGLEDELMRSMWQRNQMRIAKEAGVEPVVFAGSGHYLHVEQPDAVISTLNAWREKAREQSHAY